MLTYIMTKQKDQGFLCEYLVEKLNEHNSYRLWLIWF